VARVKRRPAPPARPPNGETTKTRGFGRLDEDAVVARVADSLPGDIEKRRSQLAMNAAIRKAYRAVLRNA
jgi:hypothetical protein